MTQKEADLTLEFLLKYNSEAKEEGLVNFLGVTGHGLTAAKMHLKSLEVHGFDTVLLPYNFILM